MKNTVKCLCIAAACAALVTAGSNPALALITNPDCNGKNENVSKKQCEQIEKACEAVNPGKAVSCTWKKDSAAALDLLIDLEQPANGNAVALKDGDCTCVLGSKPA